MESRPRILNQRNAVALLQEHGWTLTRDYGRGLTRAILRQAGLD
jgi:predicted RNA binding protein YcfA (HicA-like mRNA interferase family)